MALVALASSGVFAQPPTPTAVAPPATKRLLDQLGSAHYADREAATNKLIEDDLARPFLERLASSADAEVAARARRVITRQDQAHFKRYMRYGRDGQLERMVEGVCSSAGPVDNEEFW